MGFLTDLILDVAGDIIGYGFSRLGGKHPNDPGNAPENAPENGPGCGLSLTPMIIDNSGDTPFRLSITYWKAVSVSVEIPELRYTEGLPESSNRVLAKGRWGSGTARVKFSAGRMTETLKIYPAPESRPRKYDVIVTVRDSKGKTAQDRASVEIRENLFLCPARDWDPGRGTRFGPADDGGIREKGRNPGGYRTGADYVTRTDRSVYAFGRGTVRKAGRAGKDGMAVIIAMPVSGREVYACYTGLDTVSVTEKDEVRPGTVIGTAGMTETDRRENGFHFCVTDTFRKSGVYPEFADRMEGSVVRQDGMAFYDPEEIIRTKRLPGAGG